jgi:hypothetical protein
MCARDAFWEKLMLLTGDASEGSMMGAAPLYMTIQPYGVHRNR